MSTVRANTYLDASGGSNAVFSGVASPPNSMGFRNRLLNSDMRIDQRNAGASVTPTTNGTYTLDRWRTGLSQSSKFSVQRSSVAPAGFTNSLLVTSLSAYSVAAGDFFLLNQYIEGFNAADLDFGTANAKTVTLSFWVRSSLTGTFGGCLNNGDSSRCYPFTYTISAANTFEYKTVTIAGDTSGTWAKDNTAGMTVLFSLGAGSTYSGTAGAWSGSTLLSATGATSVVGTNGATFYITGVQLEAGTVASPFERRDYGRELIMCQRYLPVINGANSAGAYVATGVNAGANSYILYTFKVTPRVPPTGITVSSPSHFGIYNGVSAFTASGVAFNSASNDGCFINVTGATLTAGTAVGMYVTVDARIYFNGCEL